MIKPLEKLQLIKIQTKKFAFDRRWTEYLVVLISQSHNSFFYGPTITRRVFLCLCTAVRHYYFTILVCDIIRNTIIDMDMF